MLRTNVLGIYLPYFFVYLRSDGPSDLIGSPHQTDRIAPRTRTDRPSFQSLSRSAGRARRSFVKRHAQADRMANLICYGMRSVLGLCSDRLVCPIGFGNKRKLFRFVVGDIMGDIISKI